MQPNKSDSHARLVFCGCSGVMTVAIEGVLPESRVCNECGADVQVIDLLDFPAPGPNPTLLTRVEVVR